MIFVALASVEKGIHGGLVRSAGCQDDAFDKAANIQHGHDGCNHNLGTQDRMYRSNQRSLVSAKVSVKGLIKMGTSPVLTQHARQFPVQIGLVGVFVLMRFQRVDAFKDVGHYNVQERNFQRCGRNITIEIGSCDESKAKEHDRQCQGTGHETFLEFRHERLIQVLPPNG